MKAVRLSPHYRSVFASLVADLGLHVEDVDHMGPLADTRVENGRLVVHGRTLLTEVPDNVILTPHTDFASGGTFVGSLFPDGKSHHVFELGKLRDLRFICCFRFKLWWMTQRVGRTGSDLPAESQFLLIESPGVRNPGGSHEETLYTVMLPLLDGSFRASLQGNEDDGIEVCLESGDPAVVSKQILRGLYIHAGSNPFKVIGQAVRSVEEHMGSFLRREKKQLPGLLDCFGWCTWDAFYTNVNADGVLKGLDSLAKGGAPAKFLIIDDGWQSTADDEEAQKEAAVTAGTQYAKRLTDIKANDKFSKVKHMEVSTPEEVVHGLGHLVKDAKALHDLKYVYVWHALIGYWGGVKPGASCTAHYESSVVFPVHSPSVLLNQPDMKEDSLTLNGLGLVNPTKIFQFYDELHSYLAQCGVDGVKVDVQNILETLGAGFGGRVALAKAYHLALEKSIKKNFKDNGIIACMSHNTDGLYSAMQTAVVRASDDFWPRDPASHTVHIISVAYNSLFLGEFMQPDWDMFQSRHLAAEFHGAARAVGGCAVYVSDKPGEHDFNVLKKLVLPDGSVLRALLPGRPTRDSLFVDPARDLISVLKIWNMNRFGGIVGAFNCQGAAWCKVGRKYAVHDPCPDAVSSTVSAADVDGLADAAGPNWTGEVVVFSHQAGELVRLSKDAALVVSLPNLQFELFTVMPLMHLGNGVSVAPIGLVHMYNSGGSIQSVAIGSPEQGGTLASSVTVRARGAGEFTIFATHKPRSCAVDGEKVPFYYDGPAEKLSLDLKFRSGHISSIVLTF